MAKYQVLKKSYVHDRLVYPDKGEDSIIEFDGVPSRHWKPLDAEAKAAHAKLDDAFTRNKAKIAAGNKAAKADKADGGSEAAGGNEPNMTQGRDKELADDHNQGKELTPTQKQKAILDSLATLNHKDDTHWTKGGEPDLTVLKEKMGFAVSRGDVKEAAPEFVRQV